MEALARNIDYRTLCRFAILGLIFALNGCVYACIPIIFYRPQFYCQKQNIINDGTTDLQYYPCDEVEACSNNVNYYATTEYSQILSISMEYNLYCSQKIIETVILTVMAGGQIFAFVVGTAVYIHPKKQYNYFIYGNTITGLFLVSSYFVSNPYMLIPILFIWNTYYGLYMSIIFAHINFFFSGALSKFGPSAFNTAWPVFMLVYCLFTYYFGYWKDSLVFFAGIPYLILTGLLIYFKPPANPRNIVRSNPNPLSSLIHQSNTQQQSSRYNPPAIDNTNYNSNNNNYNSNNNNNNYIQMQDMKSSQSIPNAAQYSSLNSNSNIPQTASLNPQTNPSKNISISNKTKHSSNLNSSSNNNIVSTSSGNNINVTSTANPSNNNSNVPKQIKNALNQRLLDTDKHEISIKAPAAASIHSKKMEEILKNKEQNLIDIMNGEEKANQSTSAWEDFKNQLKSIHQNDKYYRNVVVFVLCWLGTNIAYFGCLLVMGDLGGNIYTNVAFSTVFEFAGNLSATFLIIKFPERQILKISFLIVGISYISCLFFDPTNQEVGNGYSITIIISLIPIIIAKGTHEMLWTVLQTYLNTILPPEFHQFSFAASNLVSVVVMDLLPFYKYFMEMIRFNQFFGYGLYCIFTYYIIDYFEDLYREDGKPILKDGIPASQQRQDIEMHFSKEDTPSQLLSTI